MMHTGRGMERILRDFGINPEHFTIGRPEAVAAFAEAAGHPPEALQRNVVLRGGVFPWRGDISQAFLSASAARYCPACLYEDGAKTDRRFRLICGGDMLPNAIGTICGSRSRHRPSHNRFTLPMRHLNI